MVFASPVFISIFLPLTFGLCVLLRRSIRWQNVCLCVLSLVFYGWGDPASVLLLIISALVNGRIARSKRDLTVLAVVLNMGMLFVFKYAGLGLSLPLGVSFFTFQALSYVLDVRAGRTEALREDGTLLLYLCLFPQLIAGPIVQWNQIAPQFEARSITPAGAARGLRRFILGLAKKVLLADVIARVADAAFACPPEGLGAPLAWLGALAYTLQIYLDFSGYSDMAIGMGWMFGFSFPENFRHPLRTASLRDFWRRWHITLTDWFRTYVYIPLGGNRHGTLKTYRNLGIVFLLTGIWHGAAWTFVLWGLWHGAFVILERMGVLRVEKWPRWMAHGYTWLVVMLGFVLFRADSVAHAFGYVAVMVAGFAQTPLRLSYLWQQLTPVNLTALALGLAVSLDAGRVIRERIAARPAGQVIGYAACVALLACSYAAMLASGYHPFIYFRF